MTTTIRDALSQLASSIGGTYEVSQFDGGYAYSITVPGSGSVSTTEMYDENIDVLAILRDQLRERGLINERHEYHLIFEGDPNPVKVVANNIRAAIALAARGKPQRILDKGALDAHVNRAQEA